MRRLRSVATGAAVIGLLAAGVPAATAEATPGTGPGVTSAMCSLQLPATVRVAAHTVTVPVRLGQDCLDAGVLMAAWQGVVNGNPLEYLGVSNFNPEFPAFRWIVDSASRSGTQRGFGVETFTGVGAEGTPQAPTSAKVLQGSGAAIYVTRNGSKVTIKTSSSYWKAALSHEGWARWGPVLGSIQYFNAMAGWVNMKNAYQDANGWYTYTYTNAGVRPYRFVLPSTSTILGSISSVVEK